MASDNSHSSVGPGAQSPPAPASRAAAGATSSVGHRPELMNDDTSGLPLPTGMIEEGASAASTNANDAREGPRTSSSSIVMKVRRFENEMKSRRQLLNELTPPLPDAQIIAEHEARMDMEEGIVTKKMKMPSPATLDTKLEMIGDDEPAPLPVEATTAYATKNNIGQEIEIVEDDDEDVPSEDDDYGYIGLMYDDGEPIIATDNNNNNEQSMTEVPPSRSNQGPENNDDNESSNNSIHDQQQMPSSSITETPPSSSSVPLLEATLVQDEPTASVYEATIVRDTPTTGDIEEGQTNNNMNSSANQAGEAETETENKDDYPWWKRNQRYTIIFGVVLVLCVIVVAILGTQLVSQGRRDDDGATTSNAANNNNDDGESKSRDGMLGEDRSDEPTKRPTAILSEEELFADPPSDDTSTVLVPLDSNVTVEEMINDGSSSSDEPPSPTAGPTGKLTQSSNLNSIVTSSQIINLVPNNGLEYNDRYGKAVSISKNTIVIGAYRDDDNGRDSGSAYVFVRDNNGDNNHTMWKEQAKLLPNDGQGRDEFGWAVSISEDANTIVIGAPRSDNDNGIDSGAAYVFVRNGDMWEQQAKLLPDDWQADWFGYDVAVSKDTVVVSAPQDDDNGFNSGSAYVFVRDGSTWSQQAKLLPPDGQAEDWFGYSIALSEDTVAVGAYMDDDDNGNDSGSAYVFVRDGDTWNQQAKLLPSDGQAGAWFGNAIALYGDTVVVAADLDDNENGNDSGSVYVFVRDEDNTWNQQAKLVPRDGQAGDYFGKAVSLSEGTIVVGAVGDDDNGYNSGSAYVFIWDGKAWNQQKKLLPNDGQVDDWFGRAVGVSKNNVVIGAQRVGDHTGSSYVFPLQ